MIEMIKKEWKKCFFPFLVTMIPTEDEQMYKDIRFGSLL